MAKVLIAVYSNTGITMALARAVAVKTGCELFRINPAKTYPKGFLACVFELLKEKFNKEKVVVMGRPQNLASFDTVALCFPIWDGTIPPVVKSFLEENNLAGKTIVPICTYKRSKGHCEEDIKRLCSESKVLPCIEATDLKNKAVNTISDFLKS